jgi:glycosidase
LHQQIAGSDGAIISFSLTKDDLVIDYRAPDLNRGQVKVYAALGTYRAIGSAVIPFAQNLEGSTVFLPFKADLLLMVDYSSETDVCSTRPWQKWKWSAPTITRDVKVRGARKVIVRIPRSRLGNSMKLDLAVYAKDLSENNGWGRFFGCNDPSVMAGHGDKYIPHYCEIDLQAQRAPFAKARGRLGTEQRKIRIYQLFVRLFSNRNETRASNGSLAENGVGKFNDINDAALNSLRKMGFTHIWLMGLLRQSTGTDYSEIGKPADDPDLLKGVAGSPFAIKDFFDVCPDYAVNPAAGLEELKTLLARLRQHKLKAMIDFVPNHVARCYDCEVKPQFNFGLRDDKSKFFAPQNNYFYLKPDGDGPPLQLPTWQDGRPISPTCQLPGMKCDGRFDGELDHGRATGNNVASWKPHLNDWYETVKLNYGFDFTDSRAQTREYPNAASPGKPIPDTWEKMDQVIAHWQTIGINSFRCDMSHMEPPEFWNWLIHRARERQADTVFIGEAYDNDPAKVPGSDPVLSQLNYRRSNVMFDLLDAGFNAVYDDPTYRAIKKIYEGPGWANDIDTVDHDEFVFDNSLHYAENHDEVRLAAPTQWGGIGMKVGRAVSAILFGLSRGPLLLYNGQEVGEPAAGAEGFGGDDARTSIFDYWSMPELVRWVNDHKYDGSRLSAEQKGLRAFYSQLVNLTAEPAFRDGAFYPLNPENRDNPNFGRIGDETVSGHWCYSFLRCDPEANQRFLVLVNLHPELSLDDVRVVISRAGVEFLGLTGDEPHLRFRDRLSVRPISTDCTLQEISSTGVPIPEIAPLSAYYFECSASRF